VTLLLSNGKSQDISEKDPRGFEPKHADNTRCYELMNDFVYCSLLQQLLTVFLIVYNINLYHPHCTVA
jgi:hypothetical protein